VGIIHVGAKRFPVEEVYLEDLMDWFRTDLPNDVLLKILESICSMNGTSPAAYLEMEAGGDSSDDENE
jgi:hypothetical protein